NGRWIRRKAPHAPVPAASDQRLAPENALAPTVAAPLRATPVVAPAASRANAAPKPDPPRRPAGSRLVHQRCALVHGRSSMPSDPQLQQFADTIARLHEAGQSYNALPMTVVRRFPWQHDLISLLHFVCELTCPRVLECGGLPPLLRRKLHRQTVIPTGPTAPSAVAQWSDHGTPDASWL